MKTYLPFSGFYETWHDHAIDSEVEAMFDGNEKLRGRFNDACNHSYVFERYCKAYCEQFTHDIGVKLQYLNIWSPREYNFQTDQIDAEIEPAEVRRILALVDQTAWRALVERECTSRSGFASFTPSDFDDWGEVESWNAAQVQLLLQCYGAQVLGEDEWDTDCELQLIQDFSSHGHLGNWVYDACPKAARLCAVYEYLQRRGERYALP